MANNRMWLVHRPTGKAFCLGKRMAYGWYATSNDMSAAINRFYEECAGDAQDDFVLTMEDAREAPSCVEPEEIQTKDGGRLVPILARKTPSGRRTVS